MNKTYFYRKSRPCLLALLCALIFSRISYAETLDGGCQYTIDWDYNLTIEPVDDTVGCTLPSNDNEDPSFYPWSDNAYDIQSVEIKSNVKTGISAAYLFYDFKATTWTGLDNLIVTGTSNFQGMFLSCINLSNLSGLAEWNTANATDMSHMFGGCSSLTEVSMLTKSGTGGWNTGKVTNMSGMFASCTTLTNLGNSTNPSGLATWDTAKVQNMSSMFSGCKALTDVSMLTKSGTGGWDTGEVTNMSNMFASCYKLNKLSDSTNQSGLATWNTGKVTNMSNMFEYNINNGITDLSALENWNTSLVQDMQGMFFSSNTLTDVSALKKWDVRNVANMSYMFSNCTKLTYLSELANWEVSNVTNMSYMFNDCSEVKKADFSGEYWDFSKSGLTLTCMLNGVQNAAVKLNQYNAGMKGSNLYVVGKHSHTELTGAESTDTNLVFEPYSVMVSFTGGSGTADITLTSGSAYAGNYYDNVCAQFPNEAICTAAVKKGSYNSGSTVSITNITPGDTEQKIVSVIAADEKGNKTTLAAPDYQLENIQSNYTVDVQLGYTLTYEPGAGVSGEVPAAADYKTGATVTVADGSGLTKSGYVFSCWSENGTDCITGNTFTMPSNDVTLKAVWETLYKLTYTKDEDVSGDVQAAQEYKAGAAVTLADGSGLTKTGYVFSCWSENGTDCISGNTFTMPSNDVTLKAVFTAEPTAIPTTTPTAEPTAGPTAAPTYTLIYTKDADVTGTLPATTAYSQGTVVTVASGETLSKTGYVFAGWSNGTTTYDAGETFTMPAANVTLKAVFEKLYNLTYVKDADVSGNVPAAATYKAGATVTVAGNTGNLAKSGYLFSGWFDGTKTYAPGTVFAMPDHDMTLTAKFTKDTAFYTLTFAKEDGVSGDVPQAMKVSSGILVALPAQGYLAKTGFYFAGWSDGTTIYAAGGCYLTTSRDATLTAVFKEVQPYQADYALAIPAAQTAKYPEAGNAQIAYDPSKIQAAWVEVKTAGESVALPKNEDEQGNTIFKCTDKSNPQISYPFIGWIVEKANSQQANAVDAQTRNAESTTQVYWINQTTSFPMPAYSITLRPLFSYKQYAVTFDGNGADPVTVPPTQYFYYGEFAKNLWNPLTQGAPVKEGYTFTGWKESIKGEETGNVYNYDDQFVMPENDVKLTAQFASDSEGYTLTYKSGDAQYGYPPIAETIPAGQTVTIRGNDGGLGKEGYEFTLWSDGSVEYIPGTTIVMPEEDLFLYPVFVKVPDPLPEDEVGTYSFDEAGNKFYIQFHSYDICMNYMGDDNLCRNTSTNLYNR